MVPDVIIFAALVDKNLPQIIDYLQNCDPLQLMGGQDKMVSSLQSVTIWETHIFLDKVDSRFQITDSVTCMVEHVRY